MSILNVTRLVYDDDCHKIFLFDRIPPFNDQALARSDLLYINGSKEV